MSSTSYNSGYSSGVNATGIWRAYVKSVDDDLLSITIPRLGQDNIYREVPYSGFTPTVGDKVWAVFLEGKSNQPVVLVGASDTAGDRPDITAVFAGTNLNGGGTSGEVTLNLNDNIAVDSVQFDLTANVTVGTGQVAWNSEEGTFDAGLNDGVVLQFGEEQYFYVKNKTTAAIGQGVAVGFAGTEGASGHLLIEPFLADGTYPSEYFMGVTAHEIVVDGFGYVTSFGKVRNVDTTVDCDGNSIADWVTAGNFPLLWASPTVAGGLTLIEPSNGNNKILVAAALNTKNNGTWFVRPTHHGRLSETEGVSITNIANGDILVYNSTVGVFENQRYSAGITVSDTAPSSPETGDTWFNSASGRTFVYYDFYWVEIGSGGSGGSSGGTALNFPDSPSLNDTFTAAGKVWEWDGVSWNIVEVTIDHGTLTGLDDDDHPQYSAVSRDLYVLSYMSI